MDHIRYCEILELKQPFVVIEAKNHMIALDVAESDYFE